LGRELIGIGKYILWFSRGSKGTACAEVLRQGKVDIWRSNENNEAKEEYVSRTASERRAQRSNCRQSSRASGSLGGS
jgi:hypothetical protein